MLVFILCVPLFSVVMFAADSTGTTESSTPGGSVPEPNSQETGDIRCPKADPATGIAYVCGYLKSSRIERMKPGDPTSAVVTGKPIKGATIAMYEALPTSSGKNTEMANWGLGGLHYSAVSDSSGYFKIRMRMQGPAGNLAYPVVLCDGKIGGISRVDSTYSISDVFYVNCPSTLSYETPPDILKYVSDSDRNTVLQCDPTTTGGQPLTNIGYVNKSVEIATDAVLYELQFDIRYADTSSGKIIPLHEGSWWSWDCVLKDGKTCYTEQNIPSGGYGIKSAPLRVTHNATGNLDDQVTSMAPGDPYYDNMVGYVTANILDTLPFRSSMNLYRRFELRENPTNLLQFEKAPASYLQTMFGGVAGTVSIPVKDATGATPLVSCENFKDAGKVMGVSGIINSQTAGGPAIGLSSPYQWEQMYSKLTAAQLDMPVCSHNGSPVTLRQIQPSKDATGSYTLNYEYFNPIFLLDKGGGAMGRTADSKYDSITSGGVRSNSFQLPAVSEANDPDKTASNVVLPEDTNHLSSVVAASTAATKGAYVAGGALTDNLTTPYASDYTYAKGKVIWDWGAQAKALCSKPAYNAAADVIDNAFKGVAGDQRKNDATPSTQIFYTPFSLFRDKLLKNAGNDPGSLLSKDTVDSYLSTFEAEDLKLTMDSTNWVGAFQAFFGVAGHTVEGDGPQKSFYQRKALGTPIPHNIALTYPLSEEAFPALFPAGNLAAKPTEANPIPGGGGTGYSPLYPWKPVTECHVWGNQLSADECNDNSTDIGKNCLRTCRISQTSITKPDNPNKDVSYTGCLNTWKTKHCSYDDVNEVCNCSTSFHSGPCSTNQNFACVLNGKGQTPDPSGPGGSCVLKDDGTYGDADYGGPNDNTNLNHIWCAVEQAGPYTGVIDLGRGGSGDPLMYSFRSLQEPVNGEAVGDQTPIEPIVSSSNLMVQSWATPFAGVKSYEGLGCVDSENTKNSEIGVKRMWCKDTPRVGDSGASSALLAIAAGPVFADSGSSGAVSYDPLAPTNRLFAGPAYAAFPLGGACTTADGVCDLKPSDPATPMPDEVTIEEVQARSKPACAVTFCSLDVGAGHLEDPIPNSLKQILSAAGSDWNVPAKVVLAFMYAEGYFAKSPTGDWLMYDWTEPNILAWSLPVEGTIVKKNFQTPCDDLNWGEQGTPSMFITDWDDPARSACASAGDSSLKCGIEKLVTGRGRYARRCNLLDSAYGLAKGAAAVTNTACGDWGPVQYAAALGSFTGGDPNAKPGSSYYTKMESTLTSCY